MLKGTTPTHIFHVDIDVSVIKEVKITYSQKNNVILTKRTEDCTIEDGMISTRLSQEDTFMFEPNSHVTIQVRVLTLGGDALTSNLMMRTVGMCLDDEVLV